MTATLSKDATPAADGADSARTLEPSLDADVQQQLGALLRGMYADLLNRPVPDRFVEILRHLDRGAENDRS